MKLSLFAQGMNNGKGFGSVGADSSFILLRDKALNEFLVEIANTSTSILFPELLKK